MHTYNTLRSRITALAKNNKSIPSAAGRATYSHFRLEENTLHFRRDNTGQFWEITPIPIVFINAQLQNSTRILDVN